MKGSPCSWPKEQRGPEQVRGRPGATGAETGAGAGDQCHLQQGGLPLAFFGCHSALGTKLKLEVEEGRGLRVGAPSPRCSLQQ